MSVETRVELKKRGVVVIPAKVRRSLNLEEGDELIIEIKAKVKKDIIPVTGQLEYAKTELDELVSRVRN